MNASRRICCNAANAFRPALALNNVFFEHSARRWISSNTGSDSTSPSHNAGQATHHSGSLIDALQQNNTVLATGDIGTEQIVADVSEDGMDDILGHGKASLEQDDTEHANVSLAFDPTCIKRVVEDSRPYQLSQKLADIATKKISSDGEEVIEYKGKYVRPVNREYIPHTSQPWLQGMDYRREMSPLSRLGLEAKAFADWIRPTKGEIAAREAAIQQTSGIIRKSLDIFEVEAFGSSRNGLALASSDVDLRIYNTYAAKVTASDEHRERLPPSWRTREMNLKALIRLQRFFHHHPDYLFSNIRHSRYPLLHVLHKPSGYDVQIVCANDTAKQRARIAKYLEESPHIFDIYALVKTALDIRGLTDVFRGGISSYGIFIMIIAAYNLNMKNSENPSHQMKEEAIEGEHLNPLGHLLERFLKFYGSSLNTYMYAVSADPFAIARKIEPESLRDADLRTLSDSCLRIRDNSLPYLLCLEDPEDPTNDLGSKAYGWKHIRETLRSLHQDLRAQLSGQGQCKTASYLTPFVGSAYPTYKARRKNAESYGLNACQQPANAKKQMAKALRAMFIERHFQERKEAAALRQRMAQQKESQEQTPSDQAVTTSADDSTRVVDQPQPEDSELQKESKDL